MQLMRLDGGFCDVPCYRTQRDTVPGTVWRFPTGDGKSIVVVPYQSQHAPAKAAHCVPASIESAVGGVHGTGSINELIECVRCAGEIDVGDEDPDEALQESVDAELEGWRATQDWTALEQFEKDRAEAQKERRANWKVAGVDIDGGHASAKKLPVERRRTLDERQRITREVFAHFGLPHRDVAGRPIKPSRMIDVARERAVLDAKYTEIETKHRKKYEDDKAKRAAAADANALLELGAILSAYSSRSPQRGELEELFDFIRSEMLEGKSRISPVRDADLRLVLAKIEELTGEDLTERVLLEYSPGMKVHIDELTDERAVAENIGEDCARQQVLDLCPLVAVFEDGTRHLVQSIGRSVPDDADMNLLTRLAPSRLARRRIADRCVLEPGEISDRQTAWKSTALDETRHPFNTSDYATQAQITRVFLDGSRKAWDAIRERIKKDVSPEILPGRKRPMYHGASVEAWLAKNKIRVRS